MNTFALLLGILVCTVMVSGRHYAERSEDSNTPDSDLEERKDHSQTRHRRRRWQMNYGYDYQPPANPYYADRREYDRNHDVLTQIYRLLDEISIQVRRPSPPPPPPQPIYIPYPVPYPVPQYCSCKGKNQPNVTTRFPEMEDSNQNWGVYVSNENAEEDDGGDGSRPISFTPLRPQRPMNRPSPPVEHGSSQANNQAQTTVAPKFDVPGMCNAAIISCCGFPDEKQKLCFANIGCNSISENACSPDGIAKALESFKKAYQPIIN